LSLGILPLCGKGPTHIDLTMPERSAVYDMLKTGGADFLASLAFLTRLPLPRDMASIPLAQAMRAFPVVGAAIGAAAGVLLTTLQALGLPSLAAAGLTLAGLALLTGALHEDGLADVADGFGGGRDRARKLEIMRDSRIGTYGVVTLALILVIRAACFADIAGQSWWLVICILAAAGAFSRALVVWLMATTDPARGDSLSAGAGRPSRDILLAALLVGAVAAVVLSYVTVGLFGAAVIVLAGAVPAAVIRMLALRQIGGHTGDVCGALIVVSETAMLAAASIFV
jgi:adenosylcobinamide-GDP ribazoletransferase